MPDQREISLQIRKRFAVALHMKQICHQSDMGAAFLPRAESQLGAFCERIDIVRFSSADRFQKNNHLISAAVFFQQVKAGKKLQGTLYIDNKGWLTFKPNNPPRTKSNEELVDHTSFGRVTETACSYKVYERFPKVMGLHRILDALEREVKYIKAAIFTNEIIDRV